MKKVIAGIVFVIVLIIVIAYRPFTSIGAGNVGVVLHFGANTGKVLQPGLHVINRFSTDVDVFNVQVQKEQVDANAASKDLQTVTSTVALNYHLDSNAVSALYSRVGADYKVKLIDPAIQEAVKATTANYNAEELVTNREQVRQDIQNALAGKLNSQGIIVDQLNIVNFDFSADFDAAVEAKVTAQQNALAAQNKLQQVQFEAQQTVASAEAQAKAIEIQAAAINSQGGADYVSLQAIAKWNGIYPTTVVGGNGVPLIQIGTGTSK